MALGIVCMVFMSAQLYVQWDMIVIRESKN